MVSEPVKSVCRTKTKNCDFHSVGIANSGGNHWRTTGLTHLAPANVHVEKMIIVIFNIERWAFL